MNENNPVLVINAIVNKENAAELQDYLARVMKIFGEYGGKPIGRYKTSEFILGEHSPEMIAMIEFPSANVIHELVAGADFQALGELRARVFSQLNMMICERM